MIKRNLCAKIAGLLLLSILPTQDILTQNIVTIFGQEKIEKTDEGEVFYNFRNGFLLPGGTNPGTLFNGQDMIAWMYATGNFITPKAGAVIGYSYPNMDSQVEDAYLKWLAGSKGEKSMELLPQWTWAVMEADSAGLFKRPEMRSAFLYTSYESPKEQIALLETTGGTRTYVNGMPREGDHYDFGYTLTPVKLKKGLNEFVYTPGRFGKVTSKLVKPEKAIMFTKRDMTIPDIIIGEDNSKWAAIRVINAQEKPLQGLTIRATLPDGKQEEYKTQDIMALSVRKLRYKIPAIGNSGSEGKVIVKIELLDKSGKVIDQTNVEVRQVLPSVHHERTFVSRIDGSVQYYSVAPAIRKNPEETKAMVLTVHGAGVEARNQARAYKSKDWTDIIAATNRRPYGFNWEEWGRIDGLEVLEEAKRIFKPDESKIYLTGHSMGGHGSWFLGTTYPDKFAAVAPSAGYPDIASYGRGRGDDMHDKNSTYNAFKRGGNGGRVISLAKNLKQSGVYIFHGDADSVVSPSNARRMREVLGKFHPDFCYYEYPGGEHWFGDHSVDWHPIFEFFSRHSIPQAKDVKEMDFYTASPAISPTDYWLKVEQQIKPFDLSNVQVRLNNDTIHVLKIDNVAMLVLDIPSLMLGNEQVTVNISGQALPVPSNRKAILALENDKWQIKNEVNLKHKYSGRYGGFKNAYDNNVVFVYPTKGTVKENEWYQNKARFDAETFYYRGNGSIDVIPDTEYSIAKFPDRNVIVYGNKDNNRVWPLLLKNSPIQVAKGVITIGGKTFSGDDLGTYFIYPHPGSNTASVGVVAGTGDAGMLATSPNNYISGITGFPDLMIYRADMLKDGLTGMEAAGYFDNDWTLTSQDF
ncbi:prolyl oligopeptidase family protein [Dysgonomonas alginatilytica]|uniref:Prolyl oligopeptidase family protein n=1 Tax=Dysgonomonas alginatilytica TaxID=1605892 RepID=A0A2V3PIW5_9BACT|nr:prolyl oligopeptidase family serine peptidase [Dysgonomonas alginatilytica]PXV60001.1 prolyl oligopeptidase family protein [Dysgonomonas alginatilytica]